MTTSARLSGSSIFKNLSYPWLICGIGMLFYCFNYFLRVSPSVMQNDLMQGLHITAYQFGTLAAFYYYAYTPMQIPVGMIYDRFGAKIVQFLACLTAVLGVAIFISANSFLVAGIGRFLIGLGCAFAYIGVLKLASLWGSVGIGKTFLMDCFYESLPFKNKLRLHFHSFMQHVHQALKKHQGEQDPLKNIAKELSQETLVICFDEFFVSDITDAMLLGRLLKALFLEGVSLVATSNVTPDELYKNGLQRSQFLPAIALLKQDTEVIHLQSVEDYRMRHLKEAGVFYTPLNDAARNNMEKSFNALTQGREIKTGVVIINGREIPIHKRAGDVIWFEFSALCTVPRSQNDYLEIAQQYRTVFISNVPVISEKEKDMICLFISMVDVFYDARVKLVISAEEPIDQLYNRGYMILEYTRTHSRLAEMQSSDYFANESTNHKQGSIMKKMTCLGYASDIAAHSHGGAKSPEVLQTSPFLQQLHADGIELHWDGIYRPDNQTGSVIHRVSELCKRLAHAVARQKDFFVVIGGDHSAAVGTWHGVLHAKKAPIGLIWIDAHMDSHTPLTSETGNVHGMPLAALLGYGDPLLTHIFNESPVLRPEHVCLIGVRSFESGEAELLKKLNVRIYFMDEIKQRGLDAVMQEAVARVSQGTKGFGVSIDVDSVDPKEAPGTGVPEPDGLSAKELIASLQLIANNPLLLGAEIVEFDSTKDKNQLTEKLVFDLLNVLSKGVLCDR